MAELIAQGPTPNDRWRRTLPQGSGIVLGSSPEAWQVPWEQWLSREHAELNWTGQRLQVRALAAAKNPLYFRGKEVASLELSPDDFFVIGQTTFRLTTTTAAPSPEESPLLHARTISAEELGRIPFRDAPRRLDVLTRLPKVISSAANNSEMFLHLVSLLLAGIGRADVVALVSVPPGAKPTTPVDILHWDRRVPTRGGFEPSKRLIVEAVERLKDTVVHVWAASEEPPQRTDFTLRGNFDWAFCTPVRGDACKGWGIYVAGRFDDHESSNLNESWDQNVLRDDLKFVELVASVLGSLCQVQSLEHRQTVLGRFFSPSVLRVLMEADPETALRPRESEITVLFCDMRGFSRRAEDASANLLRLLEEVSEVLGVMTREILEHRGVVADYLGDAALGFWGWPLGDADAIEQACLSALGIRTHYEAIARQPNRVGARVQVGIGLATGRAVAGRLGTLEQGKVTVFGPVVNLASRLEGMTKLLHVPIVIDEATAKIVRERMVPGRARCRRLALVKPYGMDRPVLVSELLPPLADYPDLTDEHLARYETALDAFLRGDWNEAMIHLLTMPPGDRGKDTLIEYIIRNNRTPPAGWDGVVVLGSK